MESHARLARHPNHYRSLRVHVAEGLHVASWNKKTKQIRRNLCDTDASPTRGVDTRGNITPESRIGPRVRVSASFQENTRPSCVG